MLNSLSLRDRASAMNQHGSNPGDISDQFFSGTSKRFERQEKSWQDKGQHHTGHRKRDPRGDQQSPAQPDLKSHGQEVGDSEECDGDCPQAEDAGENQDDHVPGRTGPDLFEVRGGELGLKFDQGRDVIAEVGDIADHAFAAAVHRRLISHPRKTPNPKAIPTARAG